MGVPSRGLEVQVGEECLLGVRGHRALSRYASNRAFHGLNSPRGDSLPRTLPPLSLPHCLTLRQNLRQESMGEAELVW